jgi:membrane associated rhomboid family serine protease
VNHIVSNTISLFFVGALIRYSFPKIFERVWFISLIAPGILLWFIGRPDVHIGASAWLYAMVAFVFFSGVLRLHVKLLAQSLLMVFLYGSFVWGVLPHDPTISYEGHLSGAIVGVMLAVFYRKLEPIESLRNEERVEEEEVLWDDWKHPFERELDHEKISPASDTPLPRPQGPQFRYEDGSSPDELA